MFASWEQLSLIHIDCAVVEGMPHIRVFFCLQLNAGILKTVKVCMNIIVRIDLECAVLADDELVEADDRKSAPQAVNDIVDDLIRRVELVVWADDLCQGVNGEILLWFRIRYARSR